MFPLMARRPAMDAANGGMGNLAERAASNAGNGDDEVLKFAPREKETCVGDELASAAM